MRFLNQKSDTLTIDQVIGLYKKGNFNAPVENKVFHNIQNQPTSWLHFKIANLNEDKYFSFWGAFLEYGKVYLYYNKKVIELNELSLLDSKNYTSKYRFPTWKLEKTNTLTNVFIKIKDSKRITSLKSLLYSADEFTSFTQKDSSIIGIIFAFLLTMVVILTLLFIAKKQYSLLWYAGYILIFSFDYLTNHGIDLQLQLFSTPVQHSIKRLFFQSLGATFALIFYLKFYPYNKNTLYIKNIFQFCNIVYFVTSFILGLFMIFDTIFIPKIFFWLPQRLLMILTIILHFVLIRKKVLPFYLGVGLLLPLLVYMRFLYVNPRLDLTLNEYFILDNMFYAALIVEMCLIIYYIINQLVKSEFLAIYLQNENLTLRNTFQDNILKVQQQERNKLLSNVHDSFGGYLEALKLRLLNKAENTPEKVQEILDSFYKEYRYLLNSLYAPKINSENFVENLIEFCEKLNKVTGNNTIVHNFSLKDTQLPPEKCVHLYRIISELTTNAIKYSKASEIKIKIHQNKKDFIILEVLDNGLGFDKSVTNLNSYGLENVNDRVIAMKGELDINSIKNKGTTIKITIPKND